MRLILDVQVPDDRMLHDFVSEVKAQLPQGTTFVCAGTAPENSMTMLSAVIYLGQPRDKDELRRNLCATVGEKFSLIELPTG